MQIFWIISLLAAFIYAKPVESFTSSFTQTITSEQNDSVVYEGAVYFKADRALWHYKIPNEKLIYIHPETVTVVEPELEQAIISSHNEIRRMQSLLDDWLEDGEKVIQYDGIKYLVIFKDGLPQSINYLDTLENRVSIKLSNIQIGKSIDTQLFIPQIPQEFDIINY